MIQKLNIMLFCIKEITLYINPGTETILKTVTKHNRQYKTKRYY